MLNRRAAARGAAAALMVFGLTLGVTGPARAGDGPDQARAPNNKPDKAGRAPAQGAAVARFQEAAEGWRPAVHERLCALIKGVKPGELCVFDFDNTVLCEDIGEATLIELIRSGRLSLESVPAALKLDLVINGKPRPYKSFTSLFEYYEALAWSPKSEGAGSRACHASAYTWIVEAMAGLTAAEVVAASRKALETKPGELLTCDGASVMRPFIRPEVASLLRALKAAGARVVIVSASNVWTVRTMVRDELNPLLGDQAIPARDVFGLSVFLQSPGRGLKTDRELVGEAGYADLDPATLRDWTLTPRLVQPVSTFAGKVAVIRDNLLAEGAPLLIAGDSENDHAMLRTARNRLWFGRLHKTALQRRARGLVKAAPERWLVQPVLCGKGGRLVATREAITAARGDAAPARTKLELAELQRWLDVLPSGD